MSLKVVACALPRIFQRQAVESNQSHTRPDWSSENINRHPVAFEGGPDAKAFALGQIVR